MDVFKKALRASVALFALACGAADAQQPIDATTSRLVVRFKESMAALKSTDLRAKAAHLSALVAKGAQVQATYLHPVADGQSHVVALPTEVGVREAQILADRLAADPAVESVSVDRRVRRHQMAGVEPDDAGFERQWPLLGRRADLAGGANFLAGWPYASGQGVVVAVIDSGVTDHADLAGQVVGGYDFIGDVFTGNDGDGRDADYRDPGDACPGGVTGCAGADPISSWHGTAVAGIVAARANNALSLAGAAPSARLLIGRALGRAGGYESDVADAIRWAVGASVVGIPANPNPARVVNLSLGADGPCSNPQMRGAIRAAREAGAVIVAAAGNGNGAATTSPANCEGVVAVGAHGRSGRLAGYSNHDGWVALTAPGGDVDGAVWTLGNSGSTGPVADRVTAGTGTSFAAPHVSAAAALLLAAKPQMTPAQVASALKSSAALHAPGSFCAIHVGQCGTGLLDAGAALVREASDLAPAVSVVPRARNWVQAGSSVKLVAAGIAGPGRTLSYAWRQVAGSHAATSVARPDELVVQVPAVRTQLVYEVTATDNHGLAARAQTALMVNHLPAVSVLGLDGVQVGRAFTAQAQATDPDGDRLTFGLLAGPAGMAVDAASGAIRWVPSQPGSHVVTIAAYDGFEGSVGQTSFTVTAAALPAATSPFTVAVQPAAPIAVPVQPTRSFDVALADWAGKAVMVGMLPGETLEVSFTDSALARGTLAFALKGAPAGMRIDAASGVLTWAGGVAPGVHRLWVDVTDSAPTVQAQSEKAATSPTRTVELVVKVSATETPPRAAVADAAVQAPVSTTAGSNAGAAGGGGGGSVGIVGLLLLGIAAAGSVRLGRRHGH